MEPTDEQLLSTRRAVAYGIWTCAAITMTASVVNGTAVFHAVDPSAVGTVIGLLTALAVDSCLVVVLTGDRRMQDLGLTSSWGRVLRWITLGMSLVLNCGASMLLGHHLLAAMHAFPPLLIAGMSEYGQETALVFQRRSAERVEHRRLVDEDRRRRLDDEARRITTERELAAAAERRARAEDAEREHAERREASLRRVADLLSTGAVADGPNPARGPRLVVDNTHGEFSSSLSPAGRRVVAWLAGQAAEGRDVTAMGPTQVARGADVSVNTVKKRLPEWREVALQAADARADMEATG